MLYMVLENGPSVGKIVGNMVGSIAKLKWTCYGQLHDLICRTQSCSEGLTIYRMLEKHRFLGGTHVKVHINSS